MTKPPARSNSSGPQKDLSGAGKIEILKTKRGSRLKLRVRPGARTSAIEGEHGGALKLSVAAAPEKGKANLAVEKLLADRLGVSRACVEVVAGHSARDKIVEIESLGPEAVRRLIEVLFMGMKS